ncbi:DUF3606 domain-containing protein [Ideonella sp. BN130291]|uniref:DUF3606 domain-containing protein n=1 Tax=Ideonella sp. BN130291 TaxID=3112940 RepID=UPI002E259AB3|nr:DUF3606 domain-containing protein [Ideonella sp. BN130291]
MSDSYDTLAVHDRMRILLSEPWQVAYWTRVLEVSEDELRSLVREVGNETHLVRIRLTELREAAAESQQAA